MNILAIDSSAAPASAALLKDGRLTACYYQNCGLTHSATLMPMIAVLLENCGADRQDLDLIAVSHGPGSFTGLRIGAATAKGLALGLGIGCIGVSTLAAMAEQLRDREGICVCAMDARRGQVYNANFRLGNPPIRLCDDRAVAAEQLAEELKEISEPIYIVGDGAHIAAKALESAGIPFTLPFELVSFQTAAGVAFAAGRLAEEGQAIAPEALEPVYIRLSQAERELLERGKDK